ncbi:MAG: two component transcriptional regulator, LuxR family [Chloroflexi bacterium OLB14]|nr:MAG: two component transcriptional regulator, LuxR family [Chloroflexi bacterium OLB14]
MLTIRSDDDMLFEALKNGAQGYLLKDIQSQYMLEMLRGALRGEAAISPSLAGRVLSEFRRLSKGGIAEKDNDNELTEREQQVLLQASKGATDKEIASTLNISLNTVKTHIRNILAKLHVTTRREAAKMAKTRGLV